MDVAAFHAWSQTALPKAAATPPLLWVVLALPLLVAIASLRPLAIAGCIVLPLIAGVLLVRGDPESVVLAGLIWAAAFLVAIGGWVARLAARTRRQLADQVRVLEGAVNRIEVARERALVTNVRGGGSRPASATLAGPVSASPIQAGPVQASPSSQPARTAPEAG